MRAIDELQFSLHTAQLTIEAQGLLLNKVIAERDELRRVLEFVAIEHKDEWNRRTALAFVAKYSPEDDIEQARRMIG